MNLYESQLAEKVLRLQDIMSPFHLPEIELFRSPSFHYRMRAEFRLWHDSDDLYHIVFDPVTKQRLRVDQFPYASKIINHTMQKMIKAIKPQSILRNKLFQIDYLSTISQKIVVSLLYHRQLDDEWQNHACLLREQLRSDGLDIQLIGRSAKRKICLDHDYVDECLVIQGKTMIYRQVENCFTQPNAIVNVSMLEWALDSIKSSENDLLELYCGNGNFSLVLARHFRQVLATEIFQPLVVAARFNISVNQIDNVQVVRMSARDLTQAMQKVRQFNRLKKIDLESYRFETILVDPPRCGLDDDTLTLVQSFPRILYISCNPKTLCSNLLVLSRTHRIIRLALFDQFPYTQHMECGVLLEQI